MLTAILFHFLWRNKRKSVRWALKQAEKCRDRSTAECNFEFSRTLFSPGGIAKSIYEMGCTNVQFLDFWRKFFMGFTFLSFFFSGSSGLKLVLPPILCFLRSSASTVLCLFFA